MVKEHKTTAERRRALRNDLIDAADSLVAKQGLSALTARTVANKVGCSVGHIYNVFEDLDGLITAVNSKTLSRLDRAIIKSLPKDSELADPVESLIAIGVTYSRFAFKYPHLWSALFEQGLKTDRQVPEWHMDEHVRIFTHIVMSLQAIPTTRNLKDKEIWSLARTLFSSVHGIVFLAKYELFVAVPQNEIEQQIEIVIRSIVKTQIATG